MRLGAPERRARAALRRDGEPPVAQLAAEGGDTGRHSARTPRRLADLPARETDDFVDLGVAFQELARQVLDDPGQVEIRECPPDQVHRGKGPQDVPHRPQADEQDAIAFIEAVVPAVHELSNSTSPGAVARRFDK